MGKLVVTTFVTMDGVMQAPGGAGEDPSGGFSHEGWVVPFFDEAMGEQVTRWFTGAEDFLLGRGTYEIFYASWPKMISDDQVSQKINFNKKYVASRTLSDVEWETAELLEGDVGDAVRTLKAEDGGELQVHGSAGLIQTLLAEDLVDELRLVVFPVVLGEGKRLSGDGTVPRTWKLGIHKTSSTGSVGPACPSLRGYRPVRGAGSGRHSHTGEVRPRRGGPVMTREDGAQKRRRRAGTEPHFRPDSADRRRIRGRRDVVMARPGTGTGGPAVAGRRSYDSGDVAGHARRWDQVAAVAGLVFIALIVAGFFTPDTPAADESTEAIAAQLAEDQSMHQVGLVLGFLGDVLFLVFLAGLWSRFRRSEGIAGMFSALFAIAGAVFAATIAVSEGLYLALVQGVDDAEGDPAVLRTLVVLDNWVGGVTIPAGIAMFLGVAMVILTTRTLPAWLGWLAAVTALLLVVGVGTVFDDSEEGVLDFAGFGGFLLFLIWVLATSIVLLTRAGRENTPTPREPGAAAPAA